MRPGDAEVDPRGRSNCQGNRWRRHARSALPRLVSYEKLLDREVSAGTIRELTVSQIISMSTRKSVRDHVAKAQPRRPVDLRLGRQQLASFFTASPITANRKEDSVFEQPLARARRETRRVRLYE